MEAPAGRRAWICAALLASASPGAFPQERGPDVASSPAAPEARLPASLPLRRDEGAGADTSGWSPALALLALGGAAGGLWLWRRGGAGRGKRRSAARDELAIVRLSSHALTPQASVHAVQWKSEEYLIACTAQQVTLLSRKPSAADAETLP